jgi:hypothetical protein
MMIIMIMKKWRWRQWQPRRHNDFFKDGDDKNVDNLIMMTNKMMMIWKW